MVDAYDYWSSFSWPDESPVEFEVRTITMTWPDSSTNGELLKSLLNTTSLPELNDYQVPYFTRLVPSYVD